MFMKISGDNKAKHKAALYKFIKQTGVKVSRMSVKYSLRMAVFSFARPSKRKFIIAYSLTDAGIKDSVFWEVLGADKRYLWKKDFLKDPTG